MLLEMDHQDQKVRLVLHGEDVVETLQHQGEKINPKYVRILRTCFSGLSSTTETIKN